MSCLNSQTAVRAACPARTRSWAWSGTGPTTSRAAASSSYSLHQDYSKNEVFVIHGEVLGTRTLGWNFGHGYFTFQAQFSRTLNALVAAADARSGLDARESAVTASQSSGDSVASAAGDGVNDVSGFEPDSTFLVQVEPVSLLPRVLWGGGCRNSWLPRLEYVVDYRIVDVATGATRARGSASYDDLTAGVLDPCDVRVPVEAVEVVAEGAMETDNYKYKYNLGKGMGAAKNKKLKAKTE